MKKYLTRNEKGQFIHTVWWQKITYVIKRWF